MSKSNLEKVEEAKSYLRSMLPSGSIVYTILRHRSKGGMSRELSVVTVCRDRIINLDGYVGRMLGLRLGSHDGLVVRGCGMDMGFDVVHSLAGVLYRDGYVLRHEWV